jgi:hypothetical protein
MNKTKPFDYVNSITLTKKNLMRGTENDSLMEKGYSPFLTNRSLSNYNDTIGLANEMNIRHELDNLMQYEFLINTVRSKKRYAKWNKKNGNSDLEIVKEYFQYNDIKATQALSILSEKDLLNIKRIMEKGGKNA